MNAQGGIGSLGRMEPAAVTLSGTIGFEPKESSDADDSGDNSVARAKAGT